jgi:hypothetical protein
VISASFIYWMLVYQVVWLTVVRPDSCSTWNDEESKDLSGTMGSYPEEPT